MNSLSLFKIYGDVATTEVNPSEYSDGATKIQFKLTPVRKTVKTVYISAVIKDSIGLVSLPSIANKILDEFNDTIEKIELQLLYLPHARQDRYTGDNAFTFKYSVLPILKSCPITSLTVLDPHSQAGVDLLRSELSIPVIVITQEEELRNSDMFNKLIDSEFDCVVSPDHGAIQRAEEMKEALGITAPTIILDKSRDPDTGHISFKPLGTIHSELIEKVVMFDDIGDGCWTHILAAQALKDSGVKHVTLVLSHGILSKGVNHLYPAIDELIVLQDWRTTKAEGLVVTSVEKY